MTISAWPRPMQQTLRTWNDRSRANLGLDMLDLVQLHSPPTEVYSDDAVYDTLDRIVAEGRIAAYGVSVETGAQALTAMARPKVASSSGFCRKQLRMICTDGCHWPRASYPASTTSNTTFAANDHRNFNRSGAGDDGYAGGSGRPAGLRRSTSARHSRGPYEVGLAAVRELKPLVPAGATTAQFALRWILDSPGSRWSSPVLAIAGRQKEMPPRRT